MSDREDSRRRLTRDLIFYEDDIKRIDRALATYRRDTRSQCNLLVDMEGHLVTQVGQLVGVSSETISALVAACYVSTREIARMIGEDEFATIAHQGRDECIQLTLVGERTILATVYSPKTTTAGLVRYYLAHVIEKLRTVLDAVKQRTNAAALGPDFEKDIAGSFEALFGD